MSNSLVASPTDTTSAFSGAFFIQDGQDLAHAIQSGDWVAGGVAAFSSALDTAAAIIDPIGTLIANGLGWVLDHIEPLKGWLNDLTGNASEVLAFSQTWANVGARLTKTGTNLKSQLSDFDRMSGQTVDAYLAFARGLSDQLAASGQWSAAIASGLELASSLVQMVHDLVRDAISQVVGTAISAAISIAATAGVAAPGDVAQIGARVASLATRVGRLVMNLLESLRTLRPLLKSLEGVGKDAAKFMNGLLHKSPTSHKPSSPVPSIAPVVPIKPRSSAIPIETQRRIRVLERLADRYPGAANMFRGSVFNHENAHRYDYNEITLDVKNTSADGSLEVRRTRIDSYTVDEAVVSRKNTQLAEVHPATATHYIDEFTKNYAANDFSVTVADTPKNRELMPDLIGEPLGGPMLMEVPQQNSPIPQEIVDYAAARGITFVFAPPK